MMKKQVAGYIRRKLQRSMAEASEAGSQDEFAMMASMKLVLESVGTLETRLDHCPCGHMTRGTSGKADKKLAYEKGRAQVDDAFWKPTGKDDPASCLNFDLSLPSPVPSESLKKQLAGSSFPDGFKVQSFENDVIRVSDQSRTRTMSLPPGQSRSLSVLDQSGTSPMPLPNGKGRTLSSISATDALTDHILGPLTSALTGHGKAGTMQQRP